MEAQQRLALLRENNPFSSNVVGDPWEGGFSDVAAINATAFDGIRGLVRQKIRQPAEPLAALTLGEVGSGKSHLIRRLLLTQGDATGETFAYIQPIEDGDHPFQHLLREVVISLCQPLEILAGASQLHLLTARLLLATMGRDPKRGHKVAAHLPTWLEHPLAVHDAAWQGKLLNKYGTATVDFLSAAHPEVTATVVEALLRWVRGGTERKVAAQWLRGEVMAQEDLPGKAFDRSRLGEAALEEEARRLLIALGVLLGQARLTLLVCFDRLENLEGRRQLAAFEKMVEFLVDKARAMLPLVFIRGQMWMERFRLTLNQQVVDRLEMNQFSLSGCTSEQAATLIDGRLQALLGADWRTKLPFEPKLLLAKLQPGRNTPRTVITLANRRWRELLEQTPMEISTPDQDLGAIFADQYHNLLRHFDHHPPHAGQLRRALQLMVGAEDWAGKEAMAQGHRELLWAGERRYAAFLDCDSHHLRVLDTLKRAMRRLVEESPGEVVYYIRDGRLPIPALPRWPETNRRLTEFQERGGRVLYLEPSRAARWYALVILAQAVKAGEITLNRHGEEKTVTWAELRHFIRERIRQPADFLQKLESSDAAPALLQEDSEENLMKGARKKKNQRSPVTPNRESLKPTCTVKK